MNSSNITVGVEVVCNGYRGTVAEIYTGKLAGMCAVRVPGGSVAVGISELRPVTSALRFNKFDKLVA